MTFKKGTNLLEILMVLAILSIVLALITVGLVNITKKSVLKEAEAGILGIVRDAKSRTLAGVNSSQYGVHFEANQVVLFAGTTYNASSPSNKVYTLPAGARISSINLGGASDIVFARLTGQVNPTGNIVVEETGNTASNITITILSSGITQ